MESERQEFRDEINRLKGEQGKPDIKANKKTGGDISSAHQKPCGFGRVAQGKAVPQGKKCGNAIFQVNGLSLFGKCVKIKASLVAAANQPHP